MVKNLACNAGDLALIPGLGRSLGRGHSSPLQYSFLENPTDEGAWQAAVHRVAQESDTAVATEKQQHVRTHSPTHL